MLATACLLALAGPAPAAADFDVEMDGGTLRVLQPASENAAARLSIRDSGLGAFPEPPGTLIRESLAPLLVPGAGCAEVSDSDNTIVCTRNPESIVITTGARSDEVLVGGSNDLCEPRGTAVHVELNQGADKLRPLIDCRPEDPLRHSPGPFHLHPEFSAAGGSGADVLTGGFLTDTLAGDTGSDRLDGGKGSDTLDGGDGFDTVTYATHSGSVNVSLDGVANDGQPDEADNVLRVERVIGSGGNDEITGSSGANSLLGEAGNDLLQGMDGTDTLDGGPGADTLDGGNGFDTLTYAAHASGPVTVTLDGVANDGATGEGDDPRGIEKVIGSIGPDRIVGSGGDETLVGGSGSDTLNGGPGNDTLVGDVAGLPRGTDVFSGQGGNDQIDSRDGIAEDVSCGSGFDSVKADLEDNVAISPRFTFFGCESVERFAVDDGPPGRILGRSVAIGRDGLLRLRLACPRRARATCRGRLRLTTAGRPVRTLAHKRYAVRRGRTETLRLTLSRRAARRARGRGIVAARTRERGVSKKGLRGTTRLLRVRRTR